MSHTPNRLTLLQQTGNIQKEIDEMNKQLDLYIPGDVTNEEEVRMYEELFHYLRRYFFVNSAGTQEQVTGMFHAFYNTSKNQKQVYLNRLINQIEAEIEKKDEVEAVYGEEILLTKMQVVFDLLDEKGKAEFLYFIDTGKIADAKTDLSTYEEDVQTMSISAEDVAKLRLAQVLDNRNRFDARKSLSMGKPLTPEDVENFIQKRN